MEDSDSEGDALVVWSSKRTRQDSQTPSKASATYTRISSTSKARTTRQIPVPSPSPTLSPPPSPTLSPPPSPEDGRRAFKGAY